MLVGMAKEVANVARQLGWKVDQTRIASTGSIYVELVRDGREWVVVRVADHAQVYHRWLKTYSISPMEFHVEDMKDILGMPFGEVGDVLL
jgi:hypothetical protein